MARQEYGSRRAPKGPQRVGLGKKRKVKGGRIPGGPKPGGGYGGKTSPLAGRGGGRRQGRVEGTLGATGLGRAGKQAGPSPQPLSQAITGGKGRDYGKGGPRVRRGGSGKRKSGGYKVRSNKYTVGK